MCCHINSIETATKFIILMDLKEFKKTKNNTGRFTHLSLQNSELYIGNNFTKHERVNELLNNKNNNCYVLYPDEKSIVLNEEGLPSKKNNIIFIIDATWACSRKLLKSSENLKKLPKISFTHNKTSNYRIKEQPKNYCLSTIESTLCVLENLNFHNLESIEDRDLHKFLLPFEKMVDYQIELINEFKRD